MALEIIPTIKIMYPEYSVITPQTLYEFTVRSMNVQDEENFKASILTPNQFANHLNTIIWSCIVKKPEVFKTFDDYMTKLTIKDRDALLYGLYHISYKNITDYDIYCGKCEKTFSAKIDISKCFSMNPYIQEEDIEKYEKLQNTTEVPISTTTEKGYLSEDENPAIVKEVSSKQVAEVSQNIIHKRVRVKLEIANNIIATIKQPLLEDERKLNGDPLFQSTKNQAIGTELLVVDNFEILNNPNVSDERNKIVVREKDNLYILFKQLPTQDRKLIMKEYVDNFGKYSIQLKVGTSCTFCGEEAESNIDLVSQFFRALYR